MTRVRPALTTPQAQAMGVEAARRYHAERALELEAAAKEAARERQKQDFVEPLLAAGLSKSDAENAWKEHVVTKTTQEAEQARAQQQRRIGSKL
jgi:hypothetical protein